jgi:hypothetical protein
MQNAALTCATLRRAAPLTDENLPPRIVEAYPYATFRRVAFPLALLGAIAVLSSERNAVSKSSALTMKRFRRGVH